MAMKYWQGDVGNPWRALTRDKYECMDKHDQKMLRWLFENPRSHKCLAGLAKFMGASHEAACGRLMHLVLAGAATLIYPKKRGPAIVSGYIRIKISARCWEQLVGIFGQEVPA